MQVDLSGKVALVSGSTAGIGLETARLLAANGASVVLNGRTKNDRVEAVVDELKGRGARVSFAAGDITEMGACRGIVQEAVTTMGGIDVLVVSGGSSLPPDAGPHFFRDAGSDDLVTWTKSQWWSRVMLAKAALEPLIERGGGKIVFVGTDAGRHPTPGELSPGGAGAALVLSTKVLAKELGRYGIRVNTVSISVTTDTPGLKRSLAAPGTGRIFEKAIKAQLFPVQAKDVAQAILFFCSSESDAITGQTLSVNGGLCFPG